MQQVYEKLDEAVTETKILELHQGPGNMSYDTAVHMADSAERIDLGLIILFAHRASKVRTASPRRIRAETHRLTNLEGLSVVITRDR